LNGYETWFFNLREEHGLRVFENRVLRRIFGPNRKEEIADLRKLQSEELKKLNSSPDIKAKKSKQTRGVRHVARIGKTKICANI
jgi:hypothetical protein